MPQTTLDQMLPAEIFNSVKNPRTFPFGELVPEEEGVEGATPPKEEVTHEDGAKEVKDEVDVDPHKEFLDLLTKTIRQIMITDLDNDLRIVLAEINKYFEERGAKGPTPGDAPNADPAETPDVSTEEPAAGETQVPVEGDLQEQEEAALLETAPVAAAAAETAQQEVAVAKQQQIEAVKTEEAESPTGEPAAPPTAAEESKLEAKDSVLVMAEFVINRYVVPRLVPLLYAESQSSNEQHGVILVAEALRHLARLTPFKQDESEGFMEFVNPWIKEHAKPLAEWLIKQATMKVEPEKLASPGLPEKEDALVTLVHTGLSIHPDVLVQATESAVPGPYKRLSEIFTNVFKYIGDKYRVYPAVELSKLSGHLKEFKKHYFSVLPHAIYYYGDVRAGPSNYRDTALFLDDADSFEESIRGRFGFDKKVKIQWDVKEIKMSFAVSDDSAKLASTKIKNFKKSFPDTDDGAGMRCFTIEPMDGKLYVMCGRESMALTVFCGIASNAGLLKGKEANEEYWMCMSEKTKWRYEFQDMREKNEDLVKHMEEFHSEKEGAGNEDKVSAPAL